MMHTGRLVLMHWNAPTLHSTSYTEHPSNHAASSKHVIQRPFFASLHFGVQMDNLTFLNYKSTCCVCTNPTVSPFGSP